MSLLMKCHRRVQHWIIFTCLAWKINYRYLIFWKLRSFIHIHLTVLNMLEGHKLHDLEPKARRCVCCRLFPPVIDACVYWCALQNRLSSEGHVSKWMTSEWQIPLEKQCWYYDWEISNASIGVIHCMENYQQICCTGMMYRNWLGYFYRYWHRLLLNWVIICSLLRMHSVIQVAGHYLAFKSLNNCKVTGSWLLIPKTPLDYVREE